MDVIFETSNGRHFTVEIWFLPTVLEMKENIQKLHGIPVSKQTLVFNIQIMTDDHDTEFYNILQGFRIQLTIDDGSVKLVKSEDPASVHLLIKIPISKHQFGKLRNISLDLKPGKKVAICGEVGSGKSTLLAAILGEVANTEGTIQVGGRIAYVSQNAWIQTGTTLENVLFGPAMNYQRCQETLQK